MKEWRNKDEGDNAKGSGDFLPSMNLTDIVLNQFVQILVECWEKVSLV